MEYVVGQRWLSQAEPQLGLGMITEISGRHVKIFFPVTEEERIYASDNAPLIRLTYKNGDVVRDNNGIEYTIVSTEERNKLYFYLSKDKDGNESLITEPKLSPNITLSSPKQRLLSGQFDKNSAYELRVNTLNKLHFISQINAKGLLGARTNLLLHQIYIAYEVANRYAPRVLLADEVGLGKTIEAGMILHHQLHTGLAERIIIIVPENLLHQWLVEMLRKFNLHFSLFDKQRYEALLDAGEKNPFETEQLILCSLSLLKSKEEIFNSAHESAWDICVVDEAHHLYWSEENVSKEYNIVEKIAERSKGLLLLTATPEQVGINSHFARLRLIDPARFYSLNEFKKEQKNFVEIGDLISTAKINNNFSNQQVSILSKYLDKDSIDRISKIGIDALDSIKNKLLDRHGTGRVLFRNTRKAIKGFPKRIILPYPIKNKENTENQIFVSQKDTPNWILCDPRVDWLQNLLHFLKKEKVLLICSDVTTAIELENHLHLKLGIRSVAFHENLSIIERDRAAAYFIDDGMGAQILICSEIGSEGRNFQFAHHLILFDLPRNPDLLEQRIGRLDRIGQTRDIKIHIPFIINTPEEYLFKFYHEGMNTFQESISARLEIYNQFELELEAYIKSPNDEKVFIELISRVSTHTKEMKIELEKGRDKLLEMNSCNDQISQKIINEISLIESDNSLQPYMEKVFDSFGVEYEYHSKYCLAIKPGDQMLTNEFPLLSEDGNTICFDRNKAQQREEMNFMTWENPMVTNSMELIFSLDLGAVSIVTTNLKSIEVGTIIIECFFVIQCNAPKKIQINKFLNPKPIRILLASNNTELSKVLSHEQLNKLCKSMKKSTRLPILKKIQSKVEDMINDAQNKANARLIPVVNEAKEKINYSMNNEIERLVELKKLNSMIRENEINYFCEVRDQAQEKLSKACAELQAIRVVINT